MTRTLDEITTELATAKTKAERLSEELRTFTFKDTLTAGERERSERVAAGLNNTQAEIDRLDTEWRDAMLAGLRSGEFTTESGTPNYRHHDHRDDGPSNNEYARDARLRSAVHRLVDRAGQAPDEARQRVTEMVDAAEGPELNMVARWTEVTINPDYERAVAKLFRDPMNGHREFTRDELAAFQNAKHLMRAMTLTDSAGGFLVPFTLDPSIIVTSAGSVNPMRQIAAVKTTATESWSGVTSAGVTASWDAEAAEVSDDSPTLAQPTIPVHKGAAFIAASIEVASDSNIGQQVARLFLDAKDQLEAVAHTTGTGSGQPKGIITAVSAVPGSVVAATGGALTVADIYANQNALPARWRPRARWMANLSIINAGRQLVGGSGLTTSIVDDSTTPPRMLGWPLHENSVMDGTIAAGNDYVLLSGDFQQFAIVDRIGATIEYIPHLFGANRRPTGERGWYLYWRSGSDVLVPDAFRLTNYSA